MKKRFKAFRFTNLRMYIVFFITAMVAMFLERLIFSNESLFMEVITIVSIAFILDIIIFTVLMEIDYRKSIKSENQYN